MSRVNEGNLFLVIQIQLCVWYPVRPPYCLSDQERKGLQETEELEAGMFSEKMDVQLTWQMSWKEQEIFNGD